MVLFVSYFLPNPKPSRDSALNMCYLFFSFCFTIFFFSHETEIDFDPFFFRTRITFPQKLFFCRAKFGKQLVKRFSNTTFVVQCQLQLLHTIDLFFLKIWQISFNTCTADSGIDGSFSLKLVSPALLAAEKEEARAVLTLFLKKQGLSHTVAARTINKSDLFVEHLISRLHAVHKSRYLVGSNSTYYCFSLDLAYIFIVSSKLFNQIFLQDES